METSHAVTSAPPTPNLIRRILDIPEIGVGAALVVFILFFAALNQSMLSLNNFILIMRQITFTGFIAYGMIYLMLAGEIDLSTGATGGLCAAVAGYLIATDTTPEWLGLLAALGTAVFIGLLNSFFVLKIGMPSFFATLGTSFIIGQGGGGTGGGGLVNVILQAKWLELFGKIPLLNAVYAPSPFWDIPWASVILVALMLLGDFAIRRTKLGPILSATGGNKRAALSAGINVTRVKMLCFVFVSICACVSGLLALNTTNATDPVIGMNWGLWVIVIAIVGGSSMAGGVGSILGGLLAAILIQVIQIGLGAAQIQTNAQGIVVGGILIVAAILDVARRKAKKY